MLRKLISLAREKIRVHVDLKMYVDGLTMDRAEAPCDVAGHCTTFQSRYRVKGNRIEDARQSKLN